MGGEADHGKDVGDILSFCLSFFVNFYVEPLVETCHSLSDSDDSSANDS